VPRGASMAVGKINRVAFNSLITGKNTEVYPLKSGIATKDQFVSGNFQSKLEGIVKSKRSVASNAEVPFPGSKLFRKA